MSWTISIPVWGAPYVRMFNDVAAPALRAAAARLSFDVKFLLHTNSPDEVASGLRGFAVECRPISNKPTYVALQEGHADAVRSAEPGDVVVLLNADLVVSGNLFERIDELIEVEAKRAVVLLGIRTAACVERPPVDAEPRDLLEWAWAHRHQIIRDLEYPDGGSMLPTNIFWSRGESTVARGFHLHPAAVVKEESTSFRSTIDGDLLDCYERGDIHVVTDPDDCALLEVSPPERRFPVGRRLSVDAVARSMVTRASPMHRWLFEHRIAVRGDPRDVTDDYKFADEILSRLGGSTFHRRGFS